MKYKVSCPYCWDTLQLEYFGQHVFREHPEIEVPYHVDIDYFRQRYGALGVDIEEIESPTSVWND